MDWKGSCYTIPHSWYAVLLLSHLGSIWGRCPNNKRSECGPMYSHSWERLFKIFFTLNDSPRRRNECPYSWYSVTWRYLFWLCLMSPGPELLYLWPGWPRMTVWAASALTFPPRGHLSTSLHPLHAPNSITKKRTHLKYPKLQKHWKVAYILTDFAIRRKRKLYYCSVSKIL